MSLPPILIDNHSILNASAAAIPHRLPRFRLPMPTSSAARSKNAPPALSPGVPSRSTTFFGDPPSPSSSSKGAGVSPHSQKPSFLSDRQMSVLGLTQANSQKRLRAKSRLTTTAKMSASNTDLSSNLSASHPVPAKAKLTRVHSENKISDLQSRHRNFSDSNLATGVSLSRSFNRQMSKTSKATPGGGNLTARNSTMASAAAAVTNDEDSDSEDEREGRIVEWLLGVEDADAVTNQVVIEEPPRQTDTAIHVVYEGD